MEKITSLHLDFNRILIQIIVPGLVASFPYVYLYLQYHQKAKDYLYNSASTLTTLLAVISLIVGLVVENLGSRIEVAYYDKMNEAEDSSFTDIWNKFLALSYEHEPVGQRYLRNILLRMKFELFFGVSLFLFVPGIILLNQENGMFTDPLVALFLLYIAPITLAVYLVEIEGKNSSKILASVRKILVTKYNTTSVNKLKN